MIIGVYILAPLINILIVRNIGQVPLDQIFRNFFQGFGFFAGLWLITAPLVGIGFYFVNKISWYIFIGHSSLILLDFIVKWISRPVYYLKTISGTQNLLMISGNIILIMIVGYVIQKNFRAPYFQAMQRHWRESIRIPIHHVIKINGIEMEINDLSAGGCFVLRKGERLSLKTNHDILFRSDRLEINCMGQIMRQTDKGSGIMFKNITSTQKKDIRLFLKKRFSLRQQINLEGQWDNNGILKKVTLLDISKGGCFIASDISEVQEKDSGIISINIGEKKHDIPALVSWINHEGEHRKPDGFGCAFRRNHKKMMKEISEKFGGLDYTR